MIRNIWPLFFAAEKERPGNFCSSWFEGNWRGADAGSYRGSRRIGSPGEPEAKQGESFPSLVMAGAEGLGETQCLNDTPKKQGA